jgi:hypothetical protein
MLYTLYCLRIFWHSKSMAKRISELFARRHAPKQQQSGQTLYTQLSFWNLSGTSGRGVVTALMRSSMTLSPDFLPASSISFTLFSASLLASSSAFLLPLDCWKGLVVVESMSCRKCAYLGLELLVLILFLLAILVDLFLCFCFGVLYSLRSVFSIVSCGHDTRSLVLHSRASQCQ